MLFIYDSVYLTPLTAWMTTHRGSSAAENFSHRNLFSSAPDGRAQRKCPWSASSTTSYSSPVRAGLIAYRWDAAEAVTRLAAQEYPNNKALATVPSPAKTPGAGGVPLDFDPESGYEI
jgi:hypothetical protein